MLMADALLPWALCIVKGFTAMTQSPRIDSPAQRARLRAMSCCLFTARQRLGRHAPRRIQHLVAAGLLAVIVLFAGRVPAAPAAPALTAPATAAPGTTAVQDVPGSGLANGQDNVPVNASASVRGSDAYNHLPPDLPAGLDPTVALDALCLREAYPGMVETIRQEGNTLRVVLRNNTTLPYDDGLTKTPQQELDAPDVQDTLAQPYPLGIPRTLPDEGFHPGRVRSYALLDAVYGATAREVSARLVPVQFGRQTVRFSSANGAAAALQRVASKLDALLAQRPALAPYVYPMEQPYNRRPIAGTNRMSAHGYGIAIDLNPAKGPYWRWSRTPTHPAQLTWPEEIVSLFESEGFVWGGKWREFDLMHFEYRPELLCKARHASNP